MVRRVAAQKVETRRNMRGGAGEVTIRHYFDTNETKARCRLCAELTLPPGAGIGLHPHEGEDEVFIVRSGRGIATDDKKDTPVGAGDLILTGNGASHAIRNDGPDDLVITAVIMQY